MEIGISQDQFDQLKKGADIDELLPWITYEEREFLLTGALPGEVDDLYEDEYEDEQFEQPDWY